MKIRYSSNNSGGRWWLQDSHWEALRNAGWEIEDYEFVCKEEEADAKSKSGWNIDLRDWWSEDGHGKMRFMGALAKAASKQFETPGDAMREFEKITGQDVSAEGCNCCGAPHCFEWGRAVDETLPKSAEWGHASGESCLQYLYQKVPGSLREATELLNRSKS